MLTNVNKLTIIKEMMKKGKVGNDESNKKTISSVSRICCDFYASNRIFTLNKSFIVVW